MADVSCTKTERQPSTPHDPNNKYLLLPMIWEDLCLPLQWMSRHNSTCIMNMLATRFEENCKNHIVVNFERRLNQWFKYKINNKTSLLRSWQSIYPSGL